MMVITIISTINPKENPTFPFATSASLDRKGAPAAVESRIHPILTDSSRGMIRVMIYAIAGIKMKFASTARMTSLTLLRGAINWSILRLNPILDILPITKTKMDNIAKVSKISVMFYSPQDVGSGLIIGGRSFEASILLEAQVGSRSRISYGCYRIINARFRNGA
jgi:hypothetical protein